MRVPIDAAGRVSTELSAFMEKLVNDPDLETPPSLAEVRADLAHTGADAQHLAVMQGLIPRLVGDGVIEADDETPLLAEIDDLIARYGEDVVAEDFNRFE